MNSPTNSAMYINENNPQLRYMEIGDMMGYMANLTWFGFVWNRWQNQKNNFDGMGWYRYAWTFQNSPHLIYIIAFFVERVCSLFYGLDVLICNDCCRELAKKLMSLRVMIQLVFRSAKYGWGGWEVQKWMFNHAWDDLLRLFVDD